MADIQNTLQPDDENDKKPGTLKSALDAGQKQIASTAAAGDPNSPLDNQAASYYLDQMKQLNSTYAPATAPETQKTLADAMAKAETLYKSQANRNEWLEVAQLLGRAGAQFAGAQAGMSHEGKYGRNMAGLDFGPGVNFEARNDRAFREYQQSLNNAKELAGTEHQNFRDEDLNRKEKRDADQRYLEKGLGAAMEEGRQKVSESNTDRRARATEATENRRETDRIRNSNLRDVEMEQKSLAERLNAAQTVVNQLGQMDDLSGKSADQIDKALGPAAGKAGIDLAALKAQLEAKETRPRIFGGNSSEEDNAAKKQILDAEVQKVRDLIAATEARKKELLSNPKPAATPPQRAGGTEPPAPGGTPASGAPEVPVAPADPVVSVQGPSGTVGQMKKSVYDSKYAGKPGYQLMK